MTLKIHVVHGDAPKKPTKNDNLSLMMYNMTRATLLRKQFPKMTEKEISQRLGISFEQFEDLKRFASTQNHIEKGLKK